MDTETSKTSNISPVVTNFNIRDIDNGFVVSFMGTNKEVFFGNGEQVVGFVAKHMGVSCEHAGLPNNN